jgi:hypothetical protein
MVPEAALVPVSVVVSSVMFLLFDKPELTYCRTWC